MPTTGPQAAPAHPPLGALAEWRRQVRNGASGMVAGKVETYGDSMLYRAARCEYAARLCRAAGIHDGATLLLEYGANLAEGLDTTCALDHAAHGARIVEAG